MKSSSKRIVKSGKEYDRFFPVANGKTTNVKEEATVEDTIKELRTIVNTTLGQTRAIAKELQGHNIYETCQNIWNWVYNHIQYKEDEKFIEELREPARLWKDRQGDCDCYTVMISSILTNLNIPHLLRITKYSKPFPQIPHWQHVYPIVPKDRNLKKEYDYDKNRKDYIVIDCVTDKFDYEVPYKEKKDYDMQLARLSGLDGINENNDTVTEPKIVRHQELADGVVVGIDDNNKPWMLYAPTGDFKNQRWTPYVPGSIDGLGKKSKVEKKAFKAERKAYKVEKKQVKKATQGKSKEEKKAAKNELKVKKPLTNAGKAIRKVSKIVNKANPITVLIRNGLLAAMKINMKGLGNKYRYAYLTDEQALARGMNLKELQVLRNEVTLRERLFEQMGGEKKSFKNAILKGKGNKKEPVLAGFTLLGLYSVENIYETVAGYEDQFNGLGEPAIAATGTALATAVATVTAWAASMKDKTKGLFPDKAKQKEFDDEGNTTEDAQNLNTEATTFAPNSAPVTSAQIQAITQGVESGKIDPNQLAQQATGEAVNTTEKGSSWVMPVAITAGVLAALGIGYALIKNAQKPKQVVQNNPAMSGVKRKVSKKKLASKKQKIAIVNL